MSPTIRPARPDDVEAMSRVLIASITQLCHADHGDDPATIADWTANKTTEGVAAMLARKGFFMLVAEADAQVVAVGATTGDGEIALNYVDPDWRFRGISKALLAQMEADLLSCGFTEARLKSTATAQEFYRACGWRNVEDPKRGRFIDSYSMSKVLRPV